MSLGAGYLDASEPDYQVTQVALTVYSAYSIVVLLGLRLAPSFGSRVPIVLHAVDISFAAVLMVLTDAPCSYFLPFFVLIAAANRWGRRETLVTGLLMVLGLVIEGMGPVRAAIGARVRINHLLTGTSYFVVVTLLAAYLSGREKRLRAVAIAFARVVTRVRAESGPAASLVSVLREFRNLAGAADALLVVEESGTGRLFLWCAPRRSGRDRPAECFREIDSAERYAYLFPAPDGAGTWRMERDATGSGRVGAVDPHGRLREGRADWPGEFSSRHPASAIVCIDIAVQGFRSRLFLLDPSRPHDPADLRFLQAAAAQVGQGLLNLFLVHRVRSRIGENERARLARELHDGVVQSLIGIEMKLDVVRRTTEVAPATAAMQLGDIQRLLRGQVLGVRELMQQLRPREVESQKLLGCFAEATDRFHAETGIQAQFRSNVTSIQLPPRACRELSYILDEALMNVRKHSGARTVSVRFDAVNGDWSLAVEDDGKGFGFSGVLADADLDTYHVGPAVIRERAKSIGGLVSVESRPGRGTRLAVTIPRERYRSSA